MNNTNQIKTAIAKSILKMNWVINAKYLSSEYDLLPGVVKALRSFFEEETDRKVKARVAIEIIELHPDIRKYQMKSTDPSLFGGFVEAVAKFFEEE